MVEGANNSISISPGTCPSRFALVMTYCQQARWRDFASGVNCVPAPCNLGDANWVALSQPRPWVIASQATRTAVRSRLLLNHPRALY